MLPAKTDIEILNFKNSGKWYLLKTHPNLKGIERLEAKLGKEKLASTTWERKVLY